MRLLLLALISFVSANFCFGDITASEYAQRRAALRKEVSDSIVILLGNAENESQDLRSGFYQESNFYYLTGWMEPGAILVLTPSQEFLLLPKHDKEQERWTGPKVAAGDPGIAKTTGFETVLDAESFESKLPGWVEQGTKIYTLFSNERGRDILTKLLPRREVVDVLVPLARLRMMKSAEEIALIQRSTDVTIEAHRAAWKMIQAGIPEYKVAAAMSRTYFENGCERDAYSPIVGSGPNGAILHYSKNRRTLDRGELILMDVGAECSMYATDITRTVPVDGKFTRRQKELYEVVLGAQKAAIAAIKPGAMMGSRTTKNGVHQIAMDYIESHGKDRNGKPLGQYFIHSLGHHVGLDVHDPGVAAMPLAAGMVVTVEPGIYIPDEGIGIRIEDMVLVTETGAKVLSSALPREPDEIERAMAH